MRSVFSCPEDLKEPLIVYLNLDRISHVRALVIGNMVLGCRARLVGHIASVLELDPDSLNFLERCSHANSTKDATSDSRACSSLS